MRRQGGLGRTLADLLPDEKDTAPHPVGHHFPERASDGEAGEAGSQQDQDPGVDPGVTDDDAPGASTDPPGIEETEVVDLGTELVADLATDRSGLAIIYRALDGLVARYELHDAAVIIDEPGLGRQVFRSGRKPLDDPGGEALLDAEPGLYTDPPLEAAAVDAKLLNSLCVLALRMEVLRYDSWHDPLTALFDRRSFDRLLEMSVARSLRYHWPFTLVVIDLDGLKVDQRHPGTPGRRRGAPGAGRALPPGPALRGQRGPPRGRRVRAHPAEHGSGRRSDAPRAHRIHASSATGRARRSPTASRSAPPRRTTWTASSSWRTPASTKRRGLAGEPRRPRARAPQAPGCARGRLHRPRRRAADPAAGERRRPAVEPHVAGDAHRVPALRQAGRARGRALARRPRGT